MADKPVRVRRHEQRRYTRRGPARSPILPSDLRDSRILPEATRLLDRIGDGFSEAYNLIPEDDFEEQGESISDEFHEPKSRLERGLERNATGQESGRITKAEMKSALHDMREAFTRAYDLIPKHDFEEQGEKINDDYHDPEEELERLLEIK